MSFKSPPKIASMTLSLVTFGLLIASCLTPWFTEKINQSSLGTCYFDTHYYWTYYQRANCQPNNCVLGCGASNDYACGSGTCNVANTFNVTRGLIAAATAAQGTSALIFLVSGLAGFAVFSIDFVFGTLGFLCHIIGILYFSINLPNAFSQDYGSYGPCAASNGECQRFIGSANWAYSSILVNSQVNFGPGVGWILAVVALFLSVSHLSVLCYSSLTVESKIKSFFGFR